MPTMIRSSDRQTSEDEPAYERSERRLGILYLYRYKAESDHQPNGGLVRYSRGRLCLHSPLNEQPSTRRSAVC